MAESPIGGEMLGPRDDYDEEGAGKACSSGWCFAPGYHYFTLTKPSLFDKIFTKIHKRRDLPAVRVSLNVLTA